jgi:hypothetical protein
MSVKDMVGMSTEREREVEGRGFFVVWKQIWGVYILGHCTLVLSYRRGQLFVVRISGPTSRSREEERQSLLTKASCRTSTLSVNASDDREVVLRRVRALAEGAQLQAAQTGELNSGFLKRARNGGERWEGLKFDPWDKPSTFAVATHPDVSRKWSTEI